MADHSIKGKTVLIAGGGKNLGGLIARDLISTTHYDALTLTWRQTIGRIHPDDAEAVESDD